VPILWFVPVAVDTVEHCTPDDGRVDLCRYYGLYQWL